MLKKLNEKKDKGISLTAEIGGEKKHNKQEETAINDEYTSERIRNDLGIGYHKHFQVKIE